MNESGRNENFYSRGELDNHREQEDATNSRYNEQGLGRTTRKRDLLGQGLVMAADLLLERKKVSKSPRKVVGLQVLKIAGRHWKERGAMTGLDKEDARCVPTL